MTSQIRKNENLMGVITMPIDLIDYEEKAKDAVKYFLDKS